MGPSSRTFLVVLAVMLVAVAATTALTWHRGRLLRRSRNVALLLLGQVLTTALLLGAVNLHEQFYTSWSEVLGVPGPRGLVVVADGPALTPAAPVAATTVLGFGRHGTLDAWLARARLGRHGHGSVVGDITVPGAKTGYRWSARVYLPQAYFSPAYANRTFPVVEMFSGGGGGPSALFHSVPLQQALDHAIAAGTLPPLIAVSPLRNPVRVPDSQCLDDPRGFRVFTYLADDVPRALHRMLRVRHDRGGWVAMGGSSGGFCAANIALRRPEQFATVLSLSGYFSGALGRFPMGDPLPTRRDRILNTPLDRVRHVRQPMDFILVSARDDRSAMQEIGLLLGVLRGIPADHVVTITNPTGGHSSAPWRATLPSILAALARDLQDSGLRKPPCAPAAHAPALARGGG